MAKKGANTIVIEGRNNLVNVVNNCIEIGIPASMVSIMLENILNDLNTNVQKVIEQEQKDYENQIEIENQQATYVPEETYEVEENEAS